MNDDPPPTHDLRSWSQILTSLDKQAERRGARRHERREAVRFWIQGDSQPHLGYLRDISATGAFVEADGVSQGTRIRLELEKTGAPSQRTDALVMWSHADDGGAPHPELRGMGLRFLSASEQRESRW